MIIVINRFHRKCVREQSIDSQRILVLLVHRTTLTDHFIHVCRCFLYCPSLKSSFSLMNKRKEILYFIDLCACVCIYNIVCFVSVRSFEIVRLSLSPLLMLDRCVSVILSLLMIINERTTALSLTFGSDDQTFTSMALAVAHPIRNPFIFFSINDKTTD